MKPPPEYDADDTCWNCGKVGQYVGGLAYRCLDCAVEWNIPAVRKTRAELLGARAIFDENTKRQWKLEAMVDFTEPDAPHSPG